MTLRSGLGAAARATVLRPGAVRRIPVGPARGVRLEVNPGATLHVYAGTAEIELARWLRRLATPGTPCFDVGSSEGLYALTLARLTGGPVAALEFREEALAVLRRNLARNPTLASRIEVVRAYAADVVDAAQHATTLDALAEERFVPGLLKIDVEGAEATVLRGARALLAHRRPHVIVETHGPELERACGELLAACGYRPRVVHQRRVLREGRPNPHNRWLVAAGAGS